ncbi:hypothetical protein ACODUI_11660 [Stenotrophomonas geniculata]
MALIVAFASLVVSFWGVLATIVSSIAVWKLGQKANSLAESGAEQVRLERRVLADEQATDRERQSVVVLSYISAELSSIYPSVAAISAKLNTEDAVELFVHNQQWRKVWADDFVELRTPRIESILNSLHRLPSDLGGRIGRILGDMQTLRDLLVSTASKGLDDEIDEDFRAQRERWLRTLYVAARGTATRAAADIAHCSLEASRVAAGIGDAPPRI